ncbi:MAG: toll/interleukin-1 receptor domain-containing protein, partial [Candidatus Brocadiales bacterium]|nr:toll/interleukin-1 receptor domain-containing protein [Candidatus Brocadiales bacterium]
MEKAGEIKLFVSYSHKDAEDIEMFISHMAPLKNKGVIDIWLDQKINAGQEFHTEIDSRIELSDIICLFISVNFL